MKTTRVQVILDEQEMTRFRWRALHESRSLSAWLRDAGRKALNEQRIYCIWRFAKFIK